jgi:hypothetical protein
VRVLSEVESDRAAFVRLTIERGAGDWVHAMAMVASRRAGAQFCNGAA